MRDPNEGDGRPGYRFENPDALSPDHDKELSRVRAEPEESAADREKRERRAEIAAHPHTQLRGILSDLNAPAVRTGDITTRVAHLNAAFVRLTQQILQHTPPPYDSEEKINEDFRKREHAEGSDEQKPVSD